MNSSEGESKSAPAPAPASAPPPLALTPAVAASSTSTSTSSLNFVWNLLSFFIFLFSVVFPTAAAAPAAVPDPAPAPADPGFGPAANPSGRKVHVVGLLGTPDIPDDWWMATDFLVWRELLSEATSSTWLAAVDLNQPMGIILGDSYADRLKFVLRMGGITLVSTLVSLLQDFFSALQDVVERAKPEDVVIIVVCAHGEPSGAICLGGGRLPVLHLDRANVEKALKNIKVPQERIFLVVSTACFSGTWRSLSWTLLAAAGEDQESTYAVFAEMADEQGLEVPLCEERKDECFTTILTDIELDVGHSPTPGNLHSATRIFESPRRSVSDADRFMEGLRDRIGGVYRHTSFVTDPSSDSPSELPLRLFNRDFLDRFHIVGPSPPDITSPDPDAPISQASEFALSEPLTPSETATLVTLATAFHTAQHPTTASNVSAVIACSKLLSGDALPHATQRLLLSRLQCHSRACRRAAAIAEFLQWDFVEPVEKWRRKTGLTRMKEAEAAGAKIMTVFLSDTADGAWVGEGRPLWRPLGPGEWLAEAWVRAGKPVVEGSRWEEAVIHANAKAKEV
ncbi:hypothetical protein DFH09DRAFT_1336655 [Mycena vulgaris]|nr:hypothetical protein DFH09DRAFT_1336655 [Mycena vulgaris]